MFLVYDSTQLTYIISSISRIYPVLSSISHTFLSSHISHICYINIHIIYMSDICCYSPYFGQNFIISIIFRSMSISICLSEYPCYHHLSSIFPYISYHHTYPIYICIYIYIPNTCMHMLYQH